MQRFTSVEDFVRVAGGTTKWDRAATAVRSGAAGPEGVMRSVGDSLTYLLTRRRYDDERFTGHRRYLEVVSVACALDLEIAPKAELNPVGDYSDLTDREHFTGPGRPLRLLPGEVVVVDIDEAVHYPAPAGGPYVVLHVTVEGATFHNK